jgi:hypothetical protein
MLDADAGRKRKNDKEELLSSSNIDMQLRTQTEYTSPPYVSLVLLARRIHTSLQSHHAQHIPSLMLLLTKDEDVTLSVT